MKYKTLLFDLDDTLIDNVENTKAAFAAVLTAQQIDFTDQAFDRWYHIDKNFWLDWQDGRITVPDELAHETGKKSPAFVSWVRSHRFLQYFDDINADEAIELNDIYIQALTHTVIAVKDAKDVLEYLSGKYVVIIATNGPQDAARHKIEAIGCKPFVTDVLSADMFGYMKPRIEFFESIEALYPTTKKEDYLMIGDSLKSDVGFATVAGIDSCWLNLDNGEVEDGYTPTFTVRSLGELLDRL